MTDRELTDNTQLLFEYTERVRELKKRISRLEIEQKALLKFLSKDLWKRIDDKTLNTPKDKLLLDMIQSTLSAFKNELEDNRG